MRILSHFSYQGEMCICRMKKNEGELHIEEKCVSEGQMRIE